MNMSDIKTLKCNLVAELISSGKYNAAGVAILELSVCKIVIDELETSGNHVEGLLLGLLFFGGVLLLSFDVARLSGALD